MHWILYMAGTLLMVVGIYGKSQLAMIAVAFIVVGGVFHRRRHRSDRARSAYVRTELMDARRMAPSGLHDRYEGIMTALTGWKR